MSDIFNTVHRVSKEHGLDPYPADVASVSRTYMAGTIDDSKLRPAHRSAIDEEAAQLDRDQEEAAQAYANLTDEQKRRQRRSVIIWGTIFYLAIAVIAWLACHEMGVGPK